MKVLVTDLDGTLYPKNDIDGLLITQNIRSLDEWHSKGNKIIIATSRGIGHLSELKIKLSMPFAFIGANGAIIVSENGDLTERSYSASVYNEISEDALNRKLDLSVSTIYDGNWYWNTKEAYPIKNAVKKRSAWQYIIEKRKLDSAIELTQIKILIPEDDLEGYKTYLRSKYPDINIVSSDKDAIDIQAHDASKGKAMREVIGRLKVSFDDVYVIGDSENDIPMFEVTEHSYCIENGDDIAKNSANHLVGSVHELIDSLLA